MINVILNKVIIKRKTLLSVLVFLSLFSFLLNRITGSGFFMGFYFLFVISVFVISKEFANHSLFVLKLLCFFTIALAASSNFSQNYNGVLGIFMLMFMIGGVYLGYFASKIDSKRVMILLWCCFVLFLLFNFAKFGIKNVSAFTYLLHKGSENYLSAIIILLTSNVFISYKLKGEKLPIMIAVISFLISIILNGRTGIALTFGLVLIAIVDNNKSRKLLLFFMIFVLLIVSYFSIDFILTKTNFSGGLATPRELMYLEYFASLSNVKNLLFGSNYMDCCSTIIRYESPHNSFIHGHATYGILHTIFSFFVLFYVLSRRDFFFSAMIILIYIRYFFDTLGLFSGYDFTIFYLLFASKNYTKNI